MSALLYDTKEFVDPWIMSNNQCKWNPCEHEWKPFATHSIIEQTATDAVNRQHELWSWALSFI